MAHEGPQNINESREPEVAGELQETGDQQRTQQGSTGVPKAVKRPTTVLVTDDCAVLRMGLKTALAAFSDVEVVAEAWDGDSAVLQAKRFRPDVVLLDVRMPGRDGISAAEEITQLSKVVMLTHSDDPETLTAALRAGASGYLVHGDLLPEQVYGAVQAAVTGIGSFSPAAVAGLQHTAKHGITDPDDGKMRRSEWDLTPRQTDIVVLVAQGMTNAQIGRELVLTEKTIKNTLRRVFDKMEARNRAEITSKWISSYDDTTTGDAAKASKSGSQLGPRKGLSAQGISRWGH